MSAQPLSDVITSAIVRGYRVDLDSDLVQVITALLNNLPLDPRYRDHSLTGNWRGYRECHIKPDLLMIYSNDDAEILIPIPHHQRINGLVCRQGRITLPWGESPQSKQ